MEPLVAPNVDLTDFGFMPLDVRRLRDSRISASATGEEFRAAVLLWCAAWHQKPAASLPDDDVELAQLAGYGRVVREWKKVRVGALHGWLKCTDGRLYHPVIAEKANEAWAEKQDHAWSRECDRIRKENKRRADSGLPAIEIPPRPSRTSVEVAAGIPPDKPEPSAGIPTESALKGQGQGQGKEQEKSSEPNGSGGEPPSISKFIWDKARELLAKADPPPKDARKVIGAWLRDYGDDAVFAALRACEAKQTPDPIAYMAATLKKRVSSSDDDRIYRGVL